MDFEEFDESEVVFSDYSSDQSNDNEINDGNNGLRIVNRRNNDSKKKKHQRIITSSSLPMNITGNGSFRYEMDILGSDPFDQDIDDEDQTMVRLPPHVIVDRRVNGEMARSFSPLKGKHLCDVRNSILRMTGFLET